MIVKRVLLIQPPLHEEIFTFGVMEPLALEVLASCLGAGIEVDILDLRFDSHLLKRLETFVPDLVGVTGITIDYPTAVDTLRAVKTFNPDVVTVVGGHHASICQEDYFLPQVDFIVRGPGVKALPQIIEGLNADKQFGHIKGVAYRKGGTFTGADEYADVVDMGDEPLPDRKPTKKFRKKYRLAGTRAGLMTTSQGCPNRCSFCACWTVLQGKYTCRSTAEVVTELAQIPEKRIFVGDDHTFGNVQRAYSLYEAIKESGIRKEFEAYSRADTIVAHPELFKKWASIGLVGLTVGFEAVTNEQLSRYNKDGSVEINEKANEILVDCGITNFAHMIVRPDFVERDFEELKAYTLRLGIIHPVYPILTPLPGTQFHSETELVHPDKQQYYDLSHPITPTALPVTEFYGRVKDLFFSNYSYVRWGRGVLRRIVNAFTGRYHAHSAQLRFPDLFSIIVIRFLIRTQLSPGRLAKFVQAKNSLPDFYNSNEDLKEFND